MKYERIRILNETSIRIEHKGELVFANKNKVATPPKVALKDVLKYYLKPCKNSKPSKALHFVLGDYSAYYTKPHLAWLGHSSAFFTFKNCCFLIDPLFTMYASPFFLINRAFKHSKCFSSDDFKRLDILVISHSHYDHLDKKTVLALKDKVKLIICPLNLSIYLKKWGIDEAKIVELDWWQGLVFKLDDNAKLKIISTPSQHSSSRGDGINKTLWSSFVFEFIDSDSSKRVFWSADGGYYTHFKKIFSVFKDFDLLCLESAQYNEAWRYSHSFLDEIVKQAQDLGAKNVMSIHWGRFMAGSHAYNEPICFLYDKFKELNIPYITPKMGELFEIKSSYDENLKQRWFV